MVKFLLVFSPCPPKKTDVVRNVLPQVCSLYTSRSTPTAVREALKEHTEKEYDYATMHNHTHIYTPIHEEKSFQLGSFDGAKDTDMGALKLKLGDKK